MPLFPCIPLGMLTNSDGLNGPYGRYGKRGAFAAQSNLTVAERGGTTKTGYDTAKEARVAGIAKSKEARAAGRYKYLALWEDAKIANMDLAWHLCKCSEHLFVSVRFD